MNIALIGYRGTGKTTTARILAGSRRLAAIDTDERIEQTAGKSIAEIFADDGEPVFRDLEAAAVAEVLAGDDQVISLGGGAILREDTRRLLCDRASVIWLTARPETILARITSDPITTAQRPALTAAGGLDEIRQLLADRAPIYQQCAQCVIDTDCRTPEAVAHEIMRQLGLGQTSPIAPGPDDSA